MSNERYIPTKRDFRNYMQFFTGQMVSMLGSSIVSFTIIWYITITYANPIYLSIAYFCSIGIQVFMSPIGGVVADRFDRKKVIFIADTLIAIATLFYILLFTFESQIDKMVLLILILVIVCFRAIVSSFQWPATSAIVPLMVPKDKMTRLMGIRQVSYGAINIVGPALGAVLYAVWSLNLIILLDTITYFAALVPLFLLRIPKMQTSQEKSKPKKKNSFFFEFKEGFRFLLSSKGLLALFLIATFINVFEQPLWVLRPLFVSAYHGGTETSLAWIVAMGQVGTFISGALVIFKKTWKKKTLILMLALYVQIIGYLIHSLAPQGAIWVMCVGALVMGLTFPLTNAMLGAVVMILVPPEMQGRLGSILSTLCMAFMPIGIIVSGPLANAIGYVPLFVGGIILGAISITLIWLLSKMKQIDPIVEELEVKEKLAREQEEKIPLTTIEREIDETPVALAMD